MHTSTATKESSFTKVEIALTKNNFHSTVVDNRDEALDEIKRMIPQGASVMNGASRTLEEIGYIDYLKEGTHGWNNLHENILAEKDPAKQGLLRKQSTMSDYYLASVHALTQNGELMIASNTGSQMPALVFNAQNLILVVGEQKVVSDIPAGFERIEKTVIPLEDVNMRHKYGVGTSHNKTLILRKENPMMGRTVILILVREKLGF